MKFCLCLVDREKMSEDPVPRSRQHSARHDFTFQNKGLLDSELNMPHVPLRTHLQHHDDHVDGHAHTETGSGDPAVGHSTWSRLGPDKYNVAVLMFLYVLQGIPLGLAGSIPYLLQSRQVNYKDQAVFSFVFWPFSVKLLWAPIVDAIFLPSFGRRKSWLVPVQYLIGESSWNHFPLFVKSQGIILVRSLLKSMTQLGTAMLPRTMMSPGLDKASLVSSGPGKDLTSRAKLALRPG